MGMDAFGGTVSDAKVAILLPRSRYTLFGQFRRQVGNVIIPPARAALYQYFLPGCGYNRWRRS